MFIHYSNAALKSRDRTLNTRSAWSCVQHNPKETFITIKEQGNKLLQVKWTALETTGGEWGDRNTVLLGPNFINTHGNYSEITCLECTTFLCNSSWTQQLIPSPAHPQKPWNHHETSPEVPHTKAGQKKQMDCIQSKHWNSGSILWHLSGLVPAHSPGSHICWPILVWDVTNCNKSQFDNLIFPREFPYG